MNKWIRLARSLAIFLVVLPIFALAASGNSIFDDLYLWRSYFQSIIILVGLVSFPYFIRHLVNTIRG